MAEIKMASLAKQISVTRLFEAKLSKLEPETEYHQDTLDGLQSAYEQACSVTGKEAEDDAPRSIDEWRDRSSKLVSSQWRSVDQNIARLTDHEFNLAAVGSVGADELTDLASGKKLSNDGVNALVEKTAERYRKILDATGMRIGDVMINAAYALRNPKDEDRFEVCRTRSFIPFLDAIGFVSWDTFKDQFPNASAEKHQDGFYTERANILLAVTQEVQRAAEYMINRERPVSWKGFFAGEKITLLQRDWLREAVSVEFPSVRWYEEALKKWGDIPLI